jgi:hypothetical protein
MWPLFNRVHDLRLHDPRRHTRTAISQFSRTLNFFSPHPFPCEFFVCPMFRPFPQMAHPPSHRVQQCGRQSCQPRACQRPRPAAPIIIWDFDTAPVGSGGRAWAAVNSLIHLCRSHGYTERPIIFFCYTRQRFAFPGKEQTVTAIRRHIPSHSAVVRFNNIQLIWRGDLIEVGWAEWILSKKCLASMQELKPQSKHAFFRSYAPHSQALLVGSEPT